MNKKDAIRKEYDSTAEVYDEDWSYYIKSTTRETLKRIPDTDNASILDVGCGTGALLQQLAKKEWVKFITGVDLSANMLHQARGKLNRQTLLTSAEASSIPLQSNTFDLVVSSNAFHFFLEPKTFLREAERLLKPRGKLVLTDWSDDFWACRLCDYYLRLTDSAHTRVYGRDDLRQLVKETSLQITSMETYKIDWLWGLMTVIAEPSRF